MGCNETVVRVPVTWIRTYKVTVIRKTNHDSENCLFLGLQEEYLENWSTDMKRKLQDFPNTRPLYDGRWSLMMPVDGGVQLEVHPGRKSESVTDSR